MFKNYIKIAFRNILRRKSYAIINISSLAIGLACFILIFMWVNDELSYDRFHENRNEIYRITGTAILENKTVKFGYSPRPMGRALEETIPEIIHTSTFSKIADELLIRYSTKKFFEREVAAVDPYFFRIFSFPFIAGDPTTALQEPYTVVITEDIAQKYFAAEDPINKLIDIEGKPHKITGVLKNIPQNSHIKFEFLVSYHVMEEFQSNNWGSINWPCYILVQKYADKQALIAKINNLAGQHIADIMEKMKIKFSLQQLRDIHFDTEYGHEYASITEKKMIYAVALIGFLILFIACANFMNLSTAFVSNRAREISLRKVIGSSKQQLANQFLGESFLYVGIAYFIALLVVELLLPGFNNYFDKTVKIEYVKPAFLTGSLGLILITGIVAGGYPAFFLSSINPIRIFKGNIFSQQGKSPFRKALVVSQFTISIGLIICTLLVSSQFYFMLNKDIGFEKENILCIPLKGDLQKNYSTITSKLNQCAEIVNICASDYPPSALPNQTVDVKWDGKPDELTVHIEKRQVDYNYFRTLNLQIVEGREFSKDFVTDEKQAFILNEEAVRQMGIKSPIGKQFSLHDQTGTIVGVVADANYRSVKYKIAPQIYSLLTDVKECSRGILLIKIESDEFNTISKTIASIEQIMLNYNPDYPFEYYFLDETIEQYFKDVIQISSIFKYFALLAIFIACLGLFGLASFTIGKRTKEIGVRKVLGAHVYEIIILLSSHIVKWILIANLFAWPIAWFAMNKWLQNFAYRIEMSWPREITGLDFLKMFFQDPITGFHFLFSEVFISQGWWMFALAGGLALGIALLTVSWQAIRAATANPVESLRYE